MSIVAEKEPTIPPQVAASQHVFQIATGYMASAALSIAVISDQVTLVPQQQPTLSREDNRVD